LVSIKKFTLSKLKPVLLTQDAAIIFTNAGFSRGCSEYQVYMVTQRERIFLAAIQKAEFTGQPET
jgi:hypothetical protein